MKRLRKTLCTTSLKEFLKNSKATIYYYGKSMFIVQVTLKYIF